MTPARMGGIRVTKPQSKTTRLDAFLIRNQ